MSDTLEARLITLIADVTRRDASSITAASRFIEDLEVDSIDMVELVSLSEGEFDVQIPDEIIGEFRTVGDVLQCLRERANVEP